MAHWQIRPMCLSGLAAALVAGGNNSALSGLRSARHQ